MQLQQPLRVHICLLTTMLIISSCSVFVMTVLSLVSRQLFVEATSTSCGKFVSTNIVMTCTGVVGQTLTIPCGNLEESTGQFSYHFRKFINRTSFFLQWNLQVADDDLNIHCFSNDVLQGTYQLNISYPPHEVSLENSPNPINGQPIEVTCPLNGKPTPFITWTRYNDIDQRTMLPLPQSLRYRPNTSHKKWYIQVWHESMNGFYICCGNNTLGQVCYADTTSGFRLFATICDDASVRNKIGSIKTLDGRTNYPKSTKVIIQCIVHNVVQDQPPSWFFSPLNKPNTTSKIRFGDSSPYYKIQFNYNDNSCFWNSTLTINSLSINKTGTYHCSHSVDQYQVTIDLQACYKFNADSALLSLSPSNDVIAIEGSSVLLSCTVSNIDPLTEPTWCKLSDDNTACQPLNSTNTYIESNCSWISTVNLLAVAGRYQCFVPGIQKNVELFLQDTESKTSLIASLVTAGVIITAIIITSLAIAGHWYRRVVYSKTEEPSYEGFQWDVFVSFHHEAEEFAYKYIKESLEQHNYCICWHHNDFIGGRTILDNITEAVDRSRKVVFVFTENFTTSPHCMAELHHTLQRLQTTRTRCMIPIVLKEDGIPLELKELVTYWPIVEPDETFLDKLIQLLGKPMTEQNV